jgi:RsiW-degrading membrane proteinase PrsW (M82 family)
MGALQRLIIVPILSLLPCAIWLWYFATRGRYKKPPPGIIVRTFLLGALATLPAFFLSFVAQNLWLNVLGPGRWTDVLLIFFVAAPLEELLKLLVVRFYSYRRPEFDEPLDGVIYSTSAALGFAAAENVVYLTLTSPLVVLLRGPLTNPGHALFSSLWGLSLSKAKAAPNLPQVRLRIIARGWLLATLLHAVFDVLLLLSASRGLLPLVVPAAAILGLFLWVRSRIHFYRDSSPHRQGTMMVQVSVYCQECGARGFAGTECQNCHLMLPIPEELVLCVFCQRQQRPGAKFCSNCGSSMRFSQNESAEAKPHFAIVAPGGEEKVAYVLTQGEIQIGRTLNNEFVVEHPSVSKRHARITAEESEFSLHDLNSINGTFINGRRIRSAKLEDGCEVRFGSASFVYRAPQV